MTAPGNLVPQPDTEACLVRLGEEGGSGRVLTLDGDFSVYRWRKNQPFDVLINLDR